MKRRNHSRMMKGTKIVYYVIMFIILVLVLYILLGCEAINSMVQSIKGELVGNSYTIKEYDNFGNLNFTAHGDKITMHQDNTTEESNAYINITIDGYDWKHVGSTLIFMQDGVDMITDFETSSDISTSNNNSTGLMMVDRYINQFKNDIGKPVICLVSSQNGTPICLFQGDSIYFTIPDDLPKTTKLSIDGKLVYVHRANIDIFDANLLS